MEENVEGTKQRVATEVDQEGGVVVGKRKRRAGAEWFGGRGWRDTQDEAYLRTSFLSFLQLRGTLMRRGRFDDRNTSTPLRDNFTTSGWHYGGRGGKGGGREKLWK